MCSIVYIILQYEYDVLFVLTVICWMGSVKRLKFFFKFREKEILLLRKIRENMKMLVLSQL